ncbi:MAG: hypothetical protein LBQ75_09280, partial [Zoogloeaceae bacterium]|nr:hypothetical protein [Zoogloeaceae bacterium]
SHAVIAAIRAEINVKKANLSVPKNYKDSDKVEAYLVGKAAELDNSFADEYRKTSLDGARGQICVIGLAIDEDAPRAFFRDDWQDPEAERGILHDFFTTVSEEFQRRRSFSIPHFIGHNIIDFDLLFIFQRAVVLGIKPPDGIPFDARPWDPSVFDTCTKWAGVGNRVSLDKLCKALAIAGKGSEIGEDIDGSQVWDYVQRGEIAKVAEYCKGDVERTRAIFKRLTFAPVLPPSIPDSQNNSAMPDSL